MALYRHEWLKLLAAVASLIGLLSVAANASDVRENVELFSAMRADQIEVKLVPKNATQATVVIKNKTDQPLSIKLPPAFAGMPVLAQNNNVGGGNNSSNSSTQSVGGGFGGGMGGGMGGGFFNVAPERIGKIKVATVCLEHGKDDPNPRVAYELKPITEFTDSPEVASLCTMLANGKLDQSTAQAAAWHLTDGLSWQQLAQKIKVKHLNGSVEMYFNGHQLRTAAQAVAIARHLAAESTDRSPATATDAVSPGESLEPQVSLK